jgi:hypothetical protein
MLDRMGNQLRELVDEIHAVPAGPERDLVVAMLTGVERAYRDWCARQDSNLQPSHP